mmetsp:Transcript_51874/g.130244  ORF Transcript_51874/g.130244 Transcript_51874/m.130244 type:complete len:122 (+) Transcript_51874:1377-1742(+)
MWVADDEARPGKETPFSLVDDGRDADATDDEGKYETDSSADGGDEEDEDEDEDDEGKENEDEEDEDEDEEDKDGDAVRPFSSASSGVSGEDRFWCSPRPLAGDFALSGVPGGMLLLVSVCC